MLRDTGYRTAALAESVELENDIADVHGDDSEEYFTIRKQRADLLIANKRYREAREIYEDIAPYAREKYGPDSRVALDISYATALAAAGDGELTEAVQQLYTVLNGEENNQRADSAQAVRTRHALLRLLRETGQEEEIPGVLTRLYVRRAAAYGTSHLATITVANELVAVREERGEAAEALDMRAWTIREMERDYGPEYPALLDARRDYCRLLSKYDYVDRAIEAYDTLVPALQRLHGKKAAEVIEVKFGRAECLAARHRTSEAISTYRDIIHTVNDHPELGMEIALRAYRGIIAAHRRAGDSNSALREYSEVMSEMSQKLGADHTAVRELREEYEASRRKPAGS